MGVGSDSHRSSDLSSGPSDVGCPQYIGDRGVEQNLEEHDCSTGAASSTKKKKSRGGGRGGRGAKSRVRVSDDQARGAGAKARRGRLAQRKRPRKRVSDDEEEEVMPQRKRRGSAVELGDENFIKKEITDESEEEEEASAKKTRCQNVKLKNVITNREVGEEAEEIVAERGVEKFDEKERMAGKNKWQVDVEKTRKAVKPGHENFIKKEIAENSQEEDELLSKKKRYGEVERQKDLIIKREVDDGAEEVVADKCAERFHQKERTAGRKKRQVEAGKNGKAVELGDGIFLKQEIAEKSDKEDESPAKKKRRGEVKRLKNAATKREVDDEAEELMAENRAEKLNEKERTAGRKKRLAVEKMAKGYRKRGVDEEDDDDLEDKNLTMAVKNVGDSKSSRRRDQKSSEEGEIPPQRGQQGKEQQLDKKIRKKKRNAGNVKAEEAMEETEQDTEIEVTELSCMVFLFLCVI